MSEINSHLEVNRSSEKSFGVLFSIVFLIISLFPLLSFEPIRVWFLIISAVFLFVAFLVPKLLMIPNKLWFRFGLFLGSIVAPIIMALVYFFTVLPIGLIMRLLKKDLLNKKFDKKSKSYWIIRTEPMGTMKNQF